MIQNAILDYLERRKIHCAQIDKVGIFDPVKKVYRTKKKRVSQKGVADILVTYKGLSLAIEVKKDDKSNTSYEQRQWLISHIEAGGVSMVARSINEVVENFKKIDKYLSAIGWSYVKPESRFYRMFSADLQKDFFK